MFEYIHKNISINKIDQDAFKPEPDYELPIIDIAGNAAFVKIIMFKNSKHIFTDYMSLYKYSDEWKIVNKTYHRF